MAKRYDIITIGAATTDVFVRAEGLDTRKADGSVSRFETCFPLGAKLPITELDIQTGGGATNAAATFASLGFRTAPICAIGNDDNGTVLVDRLRDLGIGTSFMYKNNAHATGYSIILLSGSGERTVLVHRGASAHLKATRVDWKVFDASWCYMSSLGGDIALARRVLNHAEKKKMRVAWNPGGTELRKGMRVMGPLIKKADIVLMNKEEASALTRHPAKDLKGIIKAFTSRPKRALIITDGRNGSYAITSDGVLWSGIPDRRKPVNTTGAGDAFGSGFVAGLMKKDDLAYALAIGTWNATGVVMKTGAKRGILSRFPGPSKIKKITSKIWM